MSIREVTVGEEIQEIIRKIEVPNIALIGRTGVGKSALINAVFGSKLAEYGAGLPITKSFVRYPTNPEECSPVVLYDSPGYEAAKEAEWAKNVIKFLEEKKARKLKEQIHLIWYVINASSGRVEYFEINILKKITEQHVPAIIVLSQCDRARKSEIEGIEEALESFELKKIYALIRTASDPLRINGKPIIPPFGLTELVDKTIESLPEIYSDAIIMAQIVDLQGKRELAWKYIAATAIGCFTSGFIPIPGSTTVALIASQTALSMQIASLYGYADFAKFLSSVGTLSVSSLTNIFLTSSLDLLNTFIPPAATISGAVAATFITVIGLTYTSVFEKLARSHIYAKGREATEEFLKETFRQELKKYLHINIFSPEDIKEVKNTFLSEINDTELKDVSVPISEVNTSHFFTERENVELAEKQDLEDNKIINSISNNLTHSDEDDIAKTPSFSQRVLQFINQPITFKSRKNIP